MILMLTARLGSGRPSISATDSASDPMTGAQSESRKKREPSI